jgi:hypothetical protein
MEINIYGLGPLTLMSPVPFAPFIYSIKIVATVVKKKQKLDSTACIMSMEMIHSANFQ